MSLLEAMSPKSAAKSVSVPSPFGPAPQTSYDSARPDDRFFSLLGAGDDAAAFDSRLEREKKFDPDIWVVEIEAGSIPVEELISVKTP